MKRRLITILSAALLALATAGVASADALAGGGNSANVQLCKNGGWLALAPSASAAVFASEGACISFGARGGILVPYTANLGLRAVYLGSATAMVIVENSGPHDATNVNIVVHGDDDPGAWSIDYLKRGWTFAGFGNCSGICVIFSRPSIAAGNYAAFTLEQNIGSGSLSAEVYASDQPDPDSTPNNGDTGEDDFIRVDLAA